MVREGKIWMSKEWVKENLLEVDVYRPWNATMYKAKKNMTPNDY